MGRYLHHVEEEEKRKKEGQFCVSPSSSSSWPCPPLLHFHLHCLIKGKRDHGGRQQDAVEILMVSPRWMNAWCTFGPQYKVAPFWSHSRMWRRHNSAERNTHSRLERADDIHAYVAAISHSRGRSLWESRPRRRRPKSALNVIPPQTALFFPYSGVTPFASTYQGLKSTRNKVYKKLCLQNLSLHSKALQY